LKTSDFDYALPEEFIAQFPAQPREQARLLVLERGYQSLTHSTISNLGQFLMPGDLLVVNETRVLQARLPANKIPSGGRAEILLLSRRDELIWEALVGGRRINLGQRLELQGGLLAEVVSVLSGPRREVKFSEPIDPYMGDIGKVPLPPYIRRPGQDPERYQTIFAEAAGSAAAPTAGLHFSPGLYARLSAQGIQFASLTLHIGLDTFGPVKVDDPETHPIHTEWCSVPPNTVELVNRTHESGKRVVAVGTTCVRALETAALASTTTGRITPFEGSTNLFILPGHTFRVVDCMLTNFHLPRSTLLMMVSSFAQRELVLKAYAMATKERYRFYSFGDAMLIL
jgi:S-adenosylmethionine:tRNA ribosyltransferase-isomerase